MDLRTVGDVFMMECDNCGRTGSFTVTSQEFTELRFQIGWPPLKRVIVEEMWCRRCEYADDPRSTAVSAKLRRKLDFDENHRHHE